jgi:hypothetical protein
VIGIVGKQTCNVRLRASRVYAARHLVDDGSVTADAGDVVDSTTAQVVAETGLLRFLLVLELGDG